MPGAPGWYDDPSDASREWYWNGEAYTVSRVGYRTARPATDRRAWLTSWPAIIVGLFLCLVPGLVLLWLRPGTSVVKKGVITGLAAGLVALGAVAPSQNLPTASGPTADPATTAPASFVATPEDSGTPLPTDSETTPATASAASTSPSAVSSAAVAGTAESLALSLPVKGRAPKTGYARTMFGSGWVDVNRNGCDTRNDLLKLDLTGKTMSGTCKVLAGTLADPYTGTSIRFVYGGASEVDVDHLVSLSDAWQKGAAPWPFAKRVAFANDPLNLQPTSASVNRQKGDGDAATWLPPNKAYRCMYVARQAAVKKKYGLWVTAAEKAAMSSILSGCPNLAAPAPGPQPTIASNTGGSALSTPQPTTKATPRPTTTTSSLDPRFPTCKAAKKAGYGPYVRGVDPEYYWYRDADKDGIDCE